MKIPGGFEALSDLPNQVGEEMRDVGTCRDVGTSSPKNIPCADMSEESKLRCFMSM